MVDTYRCDSIQAPYALASRTRISGGMIANSLEVRAVPIAAITVLNPRSRDKTIFQERINRYVSVRW
jgi:hypothetical protein